MPVSWPAVLERRRTRPVLVAVLPALALALSACGGGGDGGKNATTSASSPARGCERVSQPPPKKVRRRSAPAFRLSPRKTYLATVETSCGTFEIELDAKRAPRTGGSFVTLARAGFYDDLTFHRIVPGFVIQ